MWNTWTSLWHRPSNTFGSQPVAVPAKVQVRTPNTATPPGGSGIGHPRTVAGHPIPFGPERSTKGPRLQPAFATGGGNSGALGAVGCGAHATERRATRMTAG